MKFKLENHPEGILICHFHENVNEQNALELAKGIEKSLANGKTKIILNFSPKATDWKSLSHLDKIVRSFQVLAKKMGGEIVYVLPAQFLDKIQNSVETLEAAISRILRRDDFSKLDREALIAELTKVKSRVAELETENLIVGEKLNDLLQVVNQPATQAEFAEGLKFFQALAEKIEAEPPQSGEKKK